MLRRSSRGSSSTTAAGGFSSSSSSSTTKVVESSSSRSGTTISGGASQTAVKESVRVVGGGSAQAASASGRSTTVVQSARMTGGQTTVSSSQQQSLTYESDVAQARTRMKPITSARASVMFGMSGGGGSTAMVPYAGGVGGGGRGGGGIRGVFSQEARQLAMQLESIIDTRQKDKSELWHLNERLAEYVEKTRFLEAQNKRLVAEADILKSAFSTESVTLKARYEVEIEETTRLIEASEARYIELSNRVATAEEQLQIYDSELVTIEHTNDTNLSIKERLITQLGELEGELATLRRRVGDFDTESNRYRGSIQRLRQEESDLRRDLDQERMVSMVAKNTATQLQDELNFLMETQKTKTTEMTNLAYRDTTEENRAAWHTEFSQLFRSMHSDYMKRMEEVHSEAEASFQMRVREQQSTTTKDTVESRQLTIETQRSKQQVDYLTNRSLELTTRIAQYESQLTEMTEDKRRITAEYQSTVTRLTSDLETYRAELEKTRTEVHTILDHKLSLEIEIAQYSQLLDEEEIRIKEDIQAVIQDQRQVKELMASRGIYEGAAGAGGGGYSSTTSFQSGSFSVGGGGFGGGSGGGFGMSFGGGGFGGGGSSSYSSSSYSYGGGMMSSTRF